MSIIRNLFNSSVGKKYIMAISGGFLLLFVLGHMVGNLQIFMGKETLNRYAHFLQSNKEILWPVRIFLFIMLVLHIWTSARLWFENHAARPIQYQGGYEPMASTFASRNMMLLGIIAGCFLTYHILHYTVQTPEVNLLGKDFSSPEFKIHNERDVYKMMITGFSHPIVSLFYIIGVGALCFHLSHGAHSMFQSLGLNNHYYRAILEKAATIFAIILFIGYVSIPVSVFLGLIK
ncbi:MAG: succinate dehydrogenase cytochrome b subunit [Limisphaerales bacterium]